MLESNEFKNRYSYIKNLLSGKFEICYSKVNSNIMESINWIKEDIVSVKWLHHNLLIQCRKNIYLYNTDSKKLKEHKAIKNIIYKIILVISKCSFVCETIEGYIIVVDLKNNVAEKIGKLYRGKLRMYKRIQFNYEKKVLKRIISSREEFIKNNKVDIKHDRHCAYISINDMKLVIDGFVEGHALLQTECLFLISSFTQPGKLYTISELIEKSDDFNFAFRHKIINGIPVYDNNLNSQNVIFFLHGGPESNYMQFYDYTIDKLNKLNLYRMVLINYAGSTGYSQEYQEMIYQQGGKKDIDSILTVIRSYTGKKIVIGESYGGYLSVLLSLKVSKSIDVSNVFIINGFTDIYFQLFFSKAKGLMRKYFPVGIENNIKKVNPTSLVGKGTYPCCKLTFIHSIEDTVCPVNQIFYFKKLLYRLDEGLCQIYLTKGSHQQLKLIEKKKITDILIKELTKER